MAKRDNETLKNQLEVKEKSVANYRQECTKLRKDNYDLKRQIIALKEQLSNRADNTNQAAANNNEGGNNDLAAARVLAGARPRGVRRVGAQAAAGGNPEVEAMAQVQMALQMREFENRINERQMLMMALS